VSKSRRGAKGRRARCGAACWAGVLLTFSIGLRESGHVRDRVVRVARSHGSACDALAALGLAILGSRSQPALRAHRVDDLCTRAALARTHRRVGAKRWRPRTRRAPLRRARSRSTTPRGSVALGPATACRRAAAWSANVTPSGCATRPSRPCASPPSLNSRMLAVLPGRSRTAAPTSCPRFCRRPRDPRRPQFERWLDAREARQRPFVSCCAADCTRALAAPVCGTVERTAARRSSTRSPRNSPTSRATRSSSPVSRAPRSFCSARCTDSRRPDAPDWQPVCPGGAGPTISTPISERERGRHPHHRARSSVPARVARQRAAQFAPAQVERYALRHQRSHRARRDHRVALTEHQSAGRTSIHTGASTVPCNTRCIARSDSRRFPPSDRIASRHTPPHTRSRARPGPSLRALDRRARHRGRSTASSAIKPSLRWLRRGFRLRTTPPPSRAAPRSAHRRSARCRTARESRRATRAPPMLPTRHTGSPHRAQHAMQRRRTFSGGTVFAAPTPRDERRLDRVEHALHHVPPGGVQ